MDAALTRIIWRRAKNCCEYCQMPQAFDDATFEIDHIIARKHKGTNNPGNLALSCFYCNSFKGSDISSLEPRSRKLTPPHGYDRLISRSAWCPSDMTWW